MYSCRDKNEENLKNFIANLPSDTLLTIRTYDGSNQVVHPDILWDKDHLIMAITPYPFYEDSLENPCLYLSKDGLNFSEFSKGINPLVSVPPIDHNCDPDIIFDKDSNLLIYYLETQRPYSNKVICLKQNRSTNKFERKIVLNYNLLENEHLILSPSIAQLKNDYNLFFVDMNLTKNRIKSIKSSSLAYFDKKKTKTIHLKFPSYYSPWHLDVIKSGEIYYLLTNGYYGKQEDDNYSLFLAESKDLIHWYNNREIITKKDIPDSDMNFVYRSSGLTSNDTLALWYSYVTKSRTWKLGLKKIRI